MQTKSRFTCCLIGQRSLLILCAEDLLSRGHVIRGVATESDEIRAWAAGRNVPVLSSGNSEVERLLTEEPCDYLFSIINYRVLPPTLLSLPNRGAINFHDGPLPGYAGMYVTSWALVNREAEHGVSWHSMAKEIDAGAVLKEKRFAVSADDTAFTLNAKCYEAGFDAFRTLLTELEEDSVSQRVQTAPTANGYYALRKRPDRMACLDWSRSAEDLHALHRALDFGRYENPLGCPKLVWGERVLVPRRMTVLDQPATHPAGTVDAASPSNVLRVHTATKVVELGEFCEQDGRPVEIALPASRSNGSIRLQLCAAQATPPLDRLLERVCVREAYWARRLAQRDPISLPYLPAEIHRDRPASRNFERELDVRPLCPEGDLAQLAARAAAAIYLYLGRLNGKDAFDVDFQGASLAVLPREAAAFFAPSVPLSVRLDPAASLESHVRQVEAGIKELEKYGTYARDLVLRYPQITEEHRQRLREIPDVAIAVQPADADSTLPLPQAQLTFVIREREAKISLLANADVLDERLLNKIAEELEHVLGQIGSNPSGLLSEVSVVSPAEQAVLERWNEETRLDYRPMPLSRMFDAQVERTPDATALVFGEEAVSYRELERRSNQLANLLVARGVKRGDLVGVLMDRSVEMVVGLYAVLRTGAAYVPLDPAYPAHRLAIMVEDARAEFIVTQEARTAEVQSLNAQPVVADRPDMLAGMSVSPPEVGFHPDDVAYVMYTSGSTGRPKGVMVTHGNLNSFFANIDRRLAGRPPGTWLAVTSISFDISLPELFWTLSRGARVILRGSNEDADDIATLMERHQVTHFQCTPPRATSLTWDARSRHAMRNLEVMIVGGEAMSEELARQLRSIVPGRVFNVYGPTETTVWSTMHELAAVDGPVPIGKPIANTQLYVVDDRRRPLPIGVPGELLIGGDGVGRGYVNQPELTASRFVEHGPDQFARRKVYRTGDLVRFRPDGSVEFLGRFDHQVKIRGHRIELSEIEAVLQTAPAVRQAVVHPQDDSAGSKRLVAYVVSQPGADFCPDRLREFVAERLPPFMVPSVFEPMSELPLTPSGKIDRRQLPKLNFRQAAREQQTAPRTETERQLIQLWQQMLEVTQIDPADNFFELGGDSLLGMRAISEIQKTFGVRLSTKTFLGSSLTHIAGEIDRLKATPAGSNSAESCSSGLGRFARWFKAGRRFQPVKAAGA